MIHTLALTKSSELLTDVPLERLSSDDISWYWVDFDSPDEKEVLLLSEHFKFHSLAIEDCLHPLERPKVDYYDTYNFFVFHALNNNTLTPEELDLFIGSNYIVTFHSTELEEIRDAWQKIMTNRVAWSEGQVYIAYVILDKIVDRYFPAVYRIEDQLNQIDVRSVGRRVHSFIEQVFDIREDLLKIRRTVNAMKELLYRMLNSQHLKGFRNNEPYFDDIYDHLLKLGDMIESNREITSDMRDSYLSINSHRMNTIMTILTVVTTIFIPLTFIVGVYGMNFEYMPELEWRYGYFIVMGVMAVIGVSMFCWFKRKGWFDINR